MEICLPEAREMRRLWVKDWAFAAILAANAVLTVPAFAEDVLSRKVTELRITEGTATHIVRVLRREHQVPINLITAGREGPINIEMLAGTVKEVMDELLEQDPTYTYEVIEGKVVLYPIDAKWQTVVDNVRISKIPRLTAATQYVELLRDRVPGFADLLPPPLRGNPDAPLYTDAVSLAHRATVLEHLLQLLGDDSSVMVEIVRAPSGLSMLMFQKLPGPRLGKQAAAVCDFCSPSNITYANVVDLGCPAGTCGAKIQYDIASITSDCTCAGAPLTEEVTSDWGCLPEGPITTGSCTIASNDAPGCTDTYGLCASAASYAIGTCTETYTQKLFVCGKLVQTASIVFEITRTATTCAGTVTRAVNSTESPETFACSIGDQSFVVGQAKPVLSTLTNKTDEAKEVTWVVAIQGGDFTANPTGGEINVADCAAETPASTVTCNAVGNGTITLTTTNPACTDTGQLTCTVAERGGCCAQDGSCLADVSQDECEELNGVYQGDGTTCMDTDCRKDIPTVSEWGLIVMTLLAMTLGTIMFGRRRRPVAA